jgi:hypothetical protein
MGLLNWYDWFMKDNRDIQPKVCNEEYIQHRKCELMKESREKRERVEEERKRINQLRESRKGVPIVGDMVGSSYEEGRVVEIYKGCVIYKDTRKGYGGVTRAEKISDVYIRTPKECLPAYYDTPSQTEIKRMKFFINIKYKPWSLWCDLPNDEREAVEQLSKECPF